MKTHILLLSACSLLLLSCGDSHPSEGVIPRERFVRLYADVLIAKEIAVLAHEDSLTASGRVDSLCRNYQVTRGQYETTLHYFRAELPRWKLLYEDVAKRLDSIRLGQGQQLKR